MLQRVWRNLKLMEHPIPLFFHSSSEAHLSLLFVKKAKKTQLYDKNKLQTANWNLSLGALNTFYK